MVVCSAGIAQMGSYVTLSDIPHHWQLTSLSRHEVWISLFVLLKSSCGSSHRTLVPDSYPDKIDHVTCPSVLNCFTVGFSWRLEGTVWMFWDSPVTPRAWGRVKHETDRLSIGMWTRGASHWEDQYNFPMTLSDQLIPMLTSLTISVAWKTMEDT